MSSEETPKPEERLKFREIISWKEVYVLDFWRAVIAEFLATFFFVFFSIGGIISAVVSFSTSPITIHIWILIFHFFLILVVIYAFAHLSGGHFNPSVTLATMLTLRITILRFFFYIFAQLVGAITGAGFILICFPTSMTDLYDGTFAPGPGISDANAVVIEIILTFGLLFGVFSIAFDPRGWGKLGPVGIALIVFLNAHVGIVVSFGCMNPARAFGPAVVNGKFDHHWIYWVGPLIGGSLGGITYEYLFMARSSAHSTVPSTSGVHIKQN